jgi:hypothetical protein
VKNVITVQDYTVQIQGVTCNVVLDRVFTAGELSEKTHDFFAQDTSGNVMYMGEMSRDIENGKIVSREGSWIAGLNGAMSGIIMEAAPKIGDVYTQEHLAGVAEDTGEVLALHAKARTPFGAFKNCLETQETSPLEPGVVEVKYYKAGIGLVQSHIVAGESEVLKLVEFTSA